MKQISEGKIVCELCGRQFRSVAGRPILFDESRSVFSSEEVEELTDVIQFPQNIGWRYQLRKALPAAAPRVTGLDLLAKNVGLLPDHPVVLVVGCGSTRECYAKMFPSAQLFLTDVTLQGDATAVCDGECLPFRDEGLDCVVVDQVLEHVVNPAGVVAEISRCLKPNGIVYSGVPFHAPVHGFPFDFQRYTPLGHRLLFRRFQELEFTITQGPVSAISLTLIGFFASISRNIWWRRLTSFTVRLLLKPLLWIDRRRTTPRGLMIPAASAFLGKKQQEGISTKEIILDWTAREHQHGRDRFLSHGSASDRNLGAGVITSDGIESG
ncbi:MAG: class I SAM-dependent methyltransferase [Pyrinomonadaceae bacterium]|nr:class I SAM-dependent methyltransferase [Pyrinomonadaceae bacterium]